LAVWRFRLAAALTILLIGWVGWVGFQHLSGATRQDPGLSNHGSSSLVSRPAPEALVS